MKTVRRAIDLLDCFSESRPELSVGELAALLSVHKSIASRLAAALCERKILQVDPVSRRYRIGIRLFELGQLFSPNAELDEVATPILRTLARSVGHASHVCVLDRLDVLTVSCVASEQRLQVTVEIGGRRPVHATAAGKLFLAFGPSELFEALSPGGRFPKVAPRTIETAAVMRKELAAIRKAGIAFNREESTRGVGAVAAPVFGSDGRILASVTTIFPLALVPAGDFERIGSAVKAAADKVSAGLLVRKSSVVRPLRRHAA